MLTAAVVLFCLSEAAQCHWCFTSSDNARLVVWACWTGQTPQHLGSRTVFSLFLAAASTQWHWLILT